MVNYASGRHDNIGSSNVVQHNPYNPYMGNFTAQTHNKVWGTRHGKQYIWTHPLRPQDNVLPQHFTDIMV